MLQEARSCCLCGRSIKHHRFGSPSAHKCPHGYPCTFGPGAKAPKCYKCLLSHPNREQLQKYKNVTIVHLVGPKDPDYDVFFPDNRELVGPMSREQAEQAADRWLKNFGTGTEQVVWTEYKPDTTSEPA